MTTKLLSHEWVCLQPPIAPCDDTPHGLPGAVLINGQPYLVSIAADEAGIVKDVRFDGLKLDKRTSSWSAKFYNVDAKSGACSCPHATFRNEICKHFMVAVALGLISEDAGTYATVSNGATKHEPIEEEHDFPF